jgi:hypothetical protein
MPRIQYWKRGFYWTTVQIDMVFPVAQRSRWEKRVFARAPCVWGSHLTGQLFEIPVFPGGLLGHASFGCCDSKCLLSVNQCHKHSHLFICDHPISTKKVEYFCYLIGFYVLFIGKYMILATLFPFYVDINKDLIDNSE